MRVSERKRDVVGRAGSMSQLGLCSRRIACGRE